MLIAILFIVTGVLIAIYPQLLSMIVALFLISIGITLLYLRYHYKRISREFQNPFMDFFIKY